MDKSTELSLIKESILSCTQCSLRGKHSPVPMSGPASPKIVVVGQGPGRYELQQGVPWIGKAGNYARKLLSDAGLSSIAWMNVTCCGDKPKQEHIDACRLHCRRQLQAFSAPFTLVFGLVAAEALLGFSVTMKNIHGLWIKSPTKGWMMITYHPASVIHSTYGAVQEASLRLDIERFAEGILYGDIKRPTLHEFCIKCQRFAVHYVSGVPFCKGHVPSIRKIKEPNRQMSLFDN